ncbi:MAG: RNase H family protein, partial [Chloroflexia bacterium]
LEQEQEAWLAFKDSVCVEVYTDGSAPIKNPGGQCGFAAVVVGFATDVDKSKPARPPAQARLDLGGFVAGRTTEPKTSNNRAEISGLLAAYEAIGNLRRLGCKAQHITIWSDSQYAIYCATGVWQRKKNTDLWPILDKLMQVLGKNSGVKIKWVRGHAGNEYNEIADELATEAAFNFDKVKYNRYRAAQQATGQEMPGQAALRAVTSGGAGASSTASPTRAAPPADPVMEAIAWSPNADYMLVLNAQLVKGGHPIRGPRQGEYKLWAKDGRSRSHIMSETYEQAPDEAEYRVLIGALGQIVERMSKAGRTPSDYTLMVYSKQELMVKQLKGEYRVKAPALQYAYAEASTLIKRFKQVDFLYRDARTIKQMLEDQV